MATTPQQIDPDLQTGQQYLRAGWFDRAEPLFRAAHGRYGDRPDILHYLAVCATQRGALDEASQIGVQPVTPGYRSGRRAPGVDPGGGGRRECG